jgi:hypothetical protein
MAYRECWKLNKDGAIVHHRMPSFTEMAKVEARVFPNLIPQWITENPVPGDFHIWYHSMPGRKIVNYLEQYERFDESVIVQILEGEGTIERGSYERKSNGDCWDLRESERKVAFNLPWINECFESPRAREQHLASEDKKRRKEDRAELYRYHE